MTLPTLPMYLLLLLLLLPLVVFFKKRMEIQNQDPPGPLKLPILGNLHQLVPSPMQSLVQLSKKYGPVMLLHIGRLPFVVISSAEAAREVLKVHDHICCSRPRMVGTGRISYNFLDVAFAPYTGNWRNMRKIMIMELLNLKRVQSFRFIREEEVGLLMSSLSQSSSNGATVNLTDKLYVLAANITFRMTFGLSFEGTHFDRNRFQEVVHEAEAIMGSPSAVEYLPCFSRIMDWLTGYRTRMERAFHELDAVLQEVIDDHLKPGLIKDREDMVDVLLKIEKEQYGQGTPFTNDNVKAVLVDLFLAGIGSTAVAMNWVMAELIKNPRVMKKAQDEVRNRVGSKGRVSENDADQLEYLKLVIKETLRLHPPGPLLIPRETMSSCKINGHEINPKTIIAVNALAIGRDPKSWKDPEVFFPERFADSSVDYNGHNFEFLPFGAGRRICPGLNMALIILQTAIANLLYCFDWKLPVGMKEEDIDMEGKTGSSLLVSKKQPLSLLPVSYL
ncbi:hypothetical protein K2173_002711 [Erythroxylum novogranatense]|uniref:Cytochrome P450 n=1 Tax=Erythroxylum novogranatense TaxID=1862640 RepID=A0AAV8SWU7_9ROSI|nr:hypothetical protein K2173_002711 [Erythroxylum novogranatense]